MRRGFLNYLKSGIIMSSGMDKILKSTHNKHKIAFSEQAREVIRMADVILEVLDARFIERSRIRELENHIK